MIDWNNYTEELYNNVHKFKQESELKNEAYCNNLLDNIESAIKKYSIDSEEFFLYNFEKLSEELRNTYVSQKEYRVTVSNSFDRSNIKNYISKYNCYLMFKEYFKRDVIKVESFDDYDIFKEFVSKHKKYIIKVIDGSLGANVSVVNVNENDSVKNLFFYALKYGGCIIEEFVNQDSAFAAFNESSVNTIRLTTACNDGKVEYLFSLARFGRDNEIVDNGGQGGIISMIDPLTGEVISDGYTEDLVKFTEHPNSHLTIKGFCVPRWNELLQMAETLAVMAKGVTVIGWDFALTDKGWVVIEANTQPSIFPIQMLMAQTFNHGIRKEYERLLGKYKNAQKVFDYEKL